MNNTKITFAYPISFCLARLFKISSAQKNQEFSFNNIYFAAHFTVPWTPLPEEGGPHYPPPHYALHYIASNNMISSELWNKKGVARKDYDLI